MVKLLSVVLSNATEVATGMWSNFAFKTLVTAKGQSFGNRENNIKATKQRTVTLNVSCCELSSKT